MPEDSKKNHQKKGKQEAKDQRKPKPGRKQNEKNTERAHNTSRAPKEVMDLKIETEITPNVITISKDSDVLNISEGFNAKYSKKEIKSNWAKYEMPIETYDELEDQDVGADFEKLIQMPMTAGGHFQFKHEKSWESSATATSEYDKYFDIDVENLAIALCTVPFYERNDIDITTFTDTDINNMNNRAAKYKQKYNSDKSSIAPVKESLGTDNICSDTQDKVLTQRLLAKDPEPSKVISVLEKPLKYKGLLDVVKTELSVDDSDISSVQSYKTIEQTVSDDIASMSKNKPENIDDDTKRKDPAAVSNPAVESPEDLEKWLDDFLDN